MKKITTIILLLIFSLTSEAQSLKKLGLIFDKSTFNFGDVEQWNNQPAIFTFTNKSKLSLTILPLFSENDLDVIIPDRPIKPGESIVIQAMYYTDGKGTFSRKFPIYFGSRAEPIYLKITGNIKSLSPEAYIQCPMSKPEMAKPRIELIGDVAEIDTEIPLSGTTLEIIGLQNRKEVTLFSNSKGKFGAKLPVGNYMIKVSHPNYETYTGYIYIGQTSPPLRIRLTPIIEVPLFVENNIPYKEEEILKERTKEKTERIENRDDQPKTSEIENEISDKITITKRPEEKTEVLEEKEDKPKVNERLERDIDYVKNEPRDNPFSGEDKTEQIEEIPQTLTTYKESSTPEEDTAEEILNNEEPKFVEKEKPVKEEFVEEKEIKKEESPKETTEKEPKENKNPIIEKEEILILKNMYTFRVIDKSSMEAIEDASIYLNDIYNKKNKHKNQTDTRGYSELEIEKSDYRFIATADGYISNEIRILKDDKSDIFKIFLSPVSDLYDEIYEAKRERAKENEELLSKLSFGKTEFSFAKDVPEDIPVTTFNNPRDEEIETAKLNLKEDEFKIKEKVKTPEPIIVERIVTDKEKEDSLQRVIEELEALKQKETELEEEKFAQEIEYNKQREKEKVDSLNNFIAELTAKNNKIENDLEKEKLEALKQKEADLEEKKFAQEIENNKRREKEKIDSLNNYITELTAKNNDIKNDLQKVATDKEKLEEQNQKDKEKLEALETLTSEIKDAEDNNPFSTKKYQANNIMFLIDVSTSMEKQGKMDMLKTSIKNLVGILRDIDRVAIIAYNQQTNVVLESISGDNKAEILNAIDSLKTGGLTNGVKGLTTAYERLEYYFIPDGNNQIILATDGLFSKYNNEMTETELNRLVKKQAEKNMKLTVVGFGKDEDGKDLMNKLARNGTGQYIQIKNDYMTRDVLIREIKLNSEIKAQE